MLQQSARKASATLLILLCVLLAGAPALAQSAIDTPAEPMASPAADPDEPDAEPEEEPDDEADDEPDDEPDDLCLDMPCGEEFPFDLNLLFNIGYSRSELSGLNTALQAKGYSPFGEHMLSMGGSMQFIAWNVMTEFEGNFGITAPSLNNDYFVNLTNGSLLLNLGYQFKPTPNLRIYPLVGIGAGLLDMSFTRRSLSPSFDEFLSNPGRQGRIGALLLALNAGVGLDWRWDWGFQVGLRGGYLWTPPSNWWSMTDIYSDSDNDNQRSYPVAGGPSISMSGPYLRMMIGF